MRVTLAILALGCLLQACPQSPPVAPAPDADASRAGAREACINAAALSCPEVPSADAVDECARVWGAAGSIRPVDFACLAGAQSVDTLRLCSHGFVRCRR